MTGLPDDQAIQDLLTFWFAEDTKKHWYESTLAFDDHCRARFGALVDQAAMGELDGWQATADGALALCLLLDQLPRNIFRGTPKAFATDPKAVEVASRAIEHGLDHELEIERRKFLYLPFMHSEVLADQERSIELSLALDDEDALFYARDHEEVIRRFGRFPHRNAILGRQCTDEEQAFLDDGAKDYGQSAS